MSREISVGNYGEVVACDFCNEGEETMGGCLIGSYAVCGSCCEKNGYYNPDYENKDDIDQFFPKSLTFRDNVLNYRQKAYGTRDLITKIWSID